METTVKVEFTQKFISAGELAPVVPMEVIKDEPLLYSASPDFAKSYGGPLTRAVLFKARSWFEREPPPGYHWVIDTRSHMLMPGQYPAIPGWHCDGVPRDFEGQPDLTKLNDDAWNIVAHVSTHPEGVSDTQFLASTRTIDVDEERVWQSVHADLSKPADLDLDITIGDVCGHTPGDGQLIAFSMPTIHRATPARHRGWRWWFRASMYYNRPIDQIRNHVQVYMTSEGAGW